MMADQLHLRTRVPAILNQRDSKDSFFHRLLNRKSRSGKSKSSSQQDSEYGQVPDAPILPSPNTHPLLTKPFPRDEALGGADITADIPEARWRAGAELLAQHYTSWHSHISPNITKPKVMIGKETMSNKSSREDGILGWNFFVKCYSEASVINPHMKSANTDLIGFPYHRADLIFPIPRNLLPRGLCFNAFQLQFRLTRLPAWR